MAAWGYHEPITSQRRKGAGAKPRVPQETQHESAAHALRRARVLELNVGVTRPPNSEIIIWTDAFADVLEWRDYRFEELDGFYPDELGCILLSREIPLKMFADKWHNHILKYLSTYT